MQAEFLNENFSSSMDKHIWPVFVSSGFSVALALRNTKQAEREIHAGFRWRNLKERDHLEDRGVDGRIILEWI
jgi:hypothetical protein